MVTTEPQKKVFVRGQRDRFGSKKARGPTDFFCAGLKFTAERLLRSSERVGIRELLSIPLVTGLVGSRAETRSQISTLEDKNPFS